MNRINVMSKKILSVLLAVAVLLGTINGGTMFASASETTDETATTTEETWKLLGGSGDVTWATTGKNLEPQTVEFDTTVIVTKLRLQINKLLSSTMRYRIWEIEIFDSAGNKIATTDTVTASVSSTSATKTEGDVSYLIDGNKTNVTLADDGTIASYGWSRYMGYFNTTTPANEYLDFTFAKPVEISKVIIYCDYCNYNAPLNWDIYGVVSDLNFVGEQADIAWKYEDATVESSSVIFELPIFTDKLRLYIDKINQYFNYDIIELEILDENGNNLEDNVTITVSDSMDKAGLSYLTDNSKDGYGSKYVMSNLDTRTPTDQYFDITFNEIAEVKEVKIWCWYGDTALSAFSVYASVFHPKSMLIDDEYKLDSTNDIISCVPAGTTAMEVLNKLVPSALLGASANIYDGENQVAHTTELKTGNVLRVSDSTTTYEEYQIAVFGDVNGDGQATIADTVYVENNLDTLTILQKYAASLNGWNVIGKSGAITWESAANVVESRKVEFDTIPENITSLRVRINVASKNLKYQLTEIKLYGPDGTNHAQSATLSVAEGMVTTNLKYLNNNNTKDWDPIYTSNLFTITSLEGEYFEFTWNSPVTICSVEFFSRYSKSTAPTDFDILYQFGDVQTEASATLTNQAVLEAYQPESEQLYSDEYVQQVASKVQALSGFSFTFMTDTHIDGRALYGNPSLDHLSNATRLSNLVPLKAIVHGGDLIDGVGVKSKSLGYISQAVSTLVKESDVPVLMTQGNHDDNSPYLMQVENTSEQYITAEEWYWNVTRNLEGYNIVQNQDDLDGNYFYMDFESDKIRMLVVNTNDLPYVLNEDGTLKYLATNGDFAISNEQLNWIASEALDFSGKEDWELVVISHVSLHNPIASENQPCRNSEILTDMLEAFQSGGSYTSPVYTGDFAQSVSVDFTRQGARNVIACIAGHNHADRSREINGIWYITTAASLANTRAYGTTEEDAFDIFTIDTANRKIYATRFGAGEDREFTY